MTALIDTNVLLDWLMPRTAFADDATLIVAAAERRQFDACIAAISITNIYYIARTPKGAAASTSLVAKLRRIGRVIGCDDSLFDEALALDFDDFEDAMQTATAARARADWIVTRNLADFRKSPVPVAAPAGFVARLLG